MSLPRPIGQVIAFSRFWLAREAKLLISDGTVIELAARPFAVLVALLDARGRVVSAAQLRDLVWHGAPVDANTVQAQISAIRRALGEERDLIVTVPARGYRIAGDIRIVDTPDASAGAAHGSHRDDGPASVSAVETPRPGVAAASAGPSTTCADASRDATLAAARGPLSTLPFIGRHAELSELLAIVPTRRIVTLTGAPGIGKTRLATEAAARLASHFPDGTFCAELASLSQPERIANAIGAAVGIDPDTCSGESAALAAHLGERRMLVIVDHCDHLADAAGQALDALIANTSGLHVIVTCGTPLLITGELPVAIAPLRVPADADDGKLSAFVDDALHLLCARLAHALRDAGHDTRPLDTVTLAPTAFHAAARICRRVEGVPLALELAAASIATGIVAGASLDAAIAACADALDTHVTRRTGARRVTLPRSAIAQTVIELCGGALDEPVRVALRRLGVFAGAFSCDAALDLLEAFAAPQGWQDAAQRDTGRRHLDALVAAGLVNAAGDDGGRGAARLRLPHAVRRYALVELDRHSESDAAAAHHAHYVARELERLAQASAHGGTGQPAPRMRAQARDEIDALRAALEWSIAADKVELCAAMLDHSAPLWVALSLLDEYIGWIRAALARADTVPMRHIRDEMRLRTVLARALMLRHSASDEIVASWEHAYQLATICADTPHRLRALFCLIMSALDAGHVERCLPLCAAFSEIAATAQLPAADLTARRLEGIVKAYHGKLDDAIRLLTPVVEHHGAWAVRTVGAEPPSEPVYDRDTIREANTMATGFGLSLHLVAEAILAAVHWFTGKPQASAPLRDMLCASGDESEPLADSIALTLACALAMLDDDVALAESCAASLVTCARLAGLPRWLRAGLDVQLWLDARRGDTDAARRLLGGAAKRIGRGRVVLLDVAIVATLLPRVPLDDAELIATLGAALRAAVEQGARLGEHWHGPELQRIDAALRRAAGESAGAVRAVLERAREQARHYRATRIELRITVDLEALETSAASGALRIR
ncbi:winged helix-turn-helix domain-containing protein [Paraburkholderia sp. B3]|uniref:ATP-binding protein n=1 Tax=Paraburkholderia sp. B3 TaxID=3134791 RepID=UPI0039824270